MEYIQNISEKRMYHDIPIIKCFLLLLQRYVYNKSARHFIMRLGSSISDESPTPLFQDITQLNADKLIMTVEEWLWLTEVCRWHLSIASGPVATSSFLLRSQVIPTSFLLLDSFNWIFFLKAWRMIESKKGKIEKEGMLLLKFLQQLIRDCN